MRNRNAHRRPPGPACSSLWAALLALFALFAALPACADESGLITGAAAGLQNQTAGRPAGDSTPAAYSQTADRPEKASPGEGSALAGASVPAAGPVLIKLALALIAVLVLILALQKLARRWGGSFQAGSGPEAIRIMSTRPVGPRMSLALVQVMNRTLLVGISPQGIRQIADLGEAQAVSSGGLDARRMTPRPESAGGGIWSRLTGMLTRSMAPGKRPAAGHAFALAMPPSDGGSPQAGSEPSSPGFEGELSRRLAALRDKYQSLSDLEGRKALSGLEGGLEGGRS